MILRIAIKAELNPRLQSLIRSLTGSERVGLQRAAGVEVQQYTSDHIDALKRNPDSMSSKFGAPASGHYKDAAAKVASPSALGANADEATLTINHIGFRRAFGPITITPRSAKALALPIHAAAFGRRPREIWDAMELFIPKGKRVIASRRGGQFTLMYLLCKSVTQKQDRSLLPSDERLREAAALGAEEYLHRELQKGRK